MEFLLKDYNTDDVADKIFDITGNEPFVLLAEKVNESQLWVDPSYIYVEELNINIFLGYLYGYSEKHSDYKVDCSVTLIIDKDTSKLVDNSKNERLYTTINSYNHIVLQNKTNISNDLKCRVCNDSGAFINKAIKQGLGISIIDLITPVKNHKKPSVLKALKEMETTSEKSKEPKAKNIER